MVGFEGSDTRPQLFRISLQRDTFQFECGERIVEFPFETIPAGYIYKNNSEGGSPSGGI